MNQRVEQSVRIVLKAFLCISVLTFVAHASLFLFRWVSQVSGKASKLIAQGVDDFGKMSFDEKAIYSALMVAVVTFLLMVLPAGRRNDRPE